MEHDDKTTPTHNSGILANLKNSISGRYYKKTEFHQQHCLVRIEGNLLSVISKGNLQPADKEKIYNILQQYP